MRAISIQQPWAWAILHAGKDIENRTWKLPGWVRGKMLWLHTGKQPDTLDAWDAVEDVSLIRPPPRAKLPLGAVVGLVQFSTDVPFHASCWFSGPYGWVIEKSAALIEPVPCRGRLGIWEPPEMDGHPIAKRYERAEETA